MCGISGFVDQKSSLTDLIKMQTTLRHRGPDHQGHYYDDGVGLAHNRLSIIDLSSDANQPFYFQSLVLIYNGEIYNYIELREELRGLGYFFTTNSDSEVLIKGFSHWGPDVLNKLNGMFAFAVYNKESKTLFLARDRVGVKPLYYCCDDSSIYFASELKALLSHFPIEVDNRGLSEYLTFGYTIGKSTFYKNIKKVSPGCYLTFRVGELKEIKYWDPKNYLLDSLEEKSEERLLDQLEELLVSSFKYRMVSDVPVGIFFSGGIDSTALVSILSRHYGQVNTFTIGFDDKRFDETPYARKLAKLFNTNHTEKILSLGEAKDRLDSFYKIYDEPFHDSSGIPTSLVSEVARNEGMKVVLSSEGGDELFGGYPSYQHYWEMGKNLFGYPSSVRDGVGSLLSAVDNSLMAKPFGDKIGRLGHFMQSKNWIDFYLHSISGVTHGQISRFMKGFESYRPDYLPYGEDMDRLNPIELFMMWDMEHLLPNDFLLKVDRATMFHGIEGREPFLDYRLIEFALKLPFDLKIRNGGTKYLLRKVLERYVPSNYFERPKMGFSIPLFKWFKDDMDSLFTEKLNREYFSTTWPQIDYKWVEMEIDKYTRGKSANKEMNMSMMWRFLGLMLWHEEYRK